ncbi:hypothetical protein FKW77_002838 [Venturia effusa]|uniref:Uncharacterized protein n=1 Tax=Venturia effusa TaxID=50376 RepID=A0A517LAL2_9PEZI|nr:hypothetical protein FKW77_002838 [Venturia effusa]
MKLSSIAALLMGIVSVSGGAYDLCCCATFKGGCDIDSTNKVVDMVKNLKKPLPWKIDPEYYDKEHDKAPHACRACYAQELPSKDHDQKIGAKQMTGFCNKWGFVKDVFADCFDRRTSYPPPPCPGKQVRNPIPPYNCYDPWPAPKSPGRGG